MQSNPIAVIGGGPAGLMAAETLAAAGARVDLYDAMPSVGRKFLLAGRGGLNLTHGEPLPAFLSRYREHTPWVESWLADFGPQALRDWAQGLGVDTFVGTSGRVFPAAMKAAPLLRAWLHRLRAQGVRIHARHRWTGWDESGQLRFSTPAGETRVEADAVILALGGGSWSRLGSDGAWAPMLAEKGVDVAPLRPANCGFQADWSAHFQERHAGEPLKSVAARVLDTASPDSGGNAPWRRGEIMLTRDGLEGGLVYALSSDLRQALDRTGEAVLAIDLLPDRDAAWVAGQVMYPRGAKSLSSHLRSRLNLHGAKAGLLRECLGRDDYADPARLAAAIKRLPVRLTGMRPMDEAISTAGGVRRQAMDERLMLLALPGVFCAGEMLDWDAPTGGYLLTACFAAGRAAARGALAWLH
ncbi:TIGR03862 family flavoprotein [Castellaniella denitrificans]|uniref:TIGR03862 family flavoprotein n=1 Tax=Castellaniella denitrificans TaxID=56119 RepID=UPI00362360E7